MHSAGSVSNENTYLFASENSRQMNKGKSGQTGNNTLQKVVYVVGGLVSLAAGGYLLKDSITERTVTAFVGTAAAGVSTFLAVYGLSNSRQKTDVSAGDEDLQDAAESGDIQTSSSDRALIEENSRLKTKLAELEKGQNQQQPESTQEIDALMEQLATLKASLTEKEKALIQQQYASSQEIDALKAELAKVKASLAEKEQTIRQVQSSSSQEIDALKGQLVALKASLADKEKALQQQISIMENMKELEQKLQNLQSKLEEKEKLLEENKAEIQLLTETHQNTLIDYSELEQDYESLTKNNKGLEDRIENYKKEIADLRESLTKMANVDAQSDTSNSSFRRDSVGTLTDGENVSLLLTPIKKSSSIDDEK